MDGVIIQLSDIWSNTWGPENLKFHGRFFQEFFKSEEDGHVDVVRWWYAIHNGLVSVDVLLPCKVVREESYMLEVCTPLKFKMETLGVYIMYILRPAQTL